MSKRYTSMITVILIGILTNFGIILAQDNPTIITPQNATQVKIINNYETQGARVNSVEWLADGHQLAVQNNVTTRLLNTQWLNEPSFPLPSSFPSGARVMSFSPSLNYAAVAADDYSIGLYELSSGVLLGRLSGHTASIQSLNFGIDGITLMSVDSEKNIRVWNTQVAINGGVQEDVFSGVDITSNISYSSDGKLVAFVSTNGLEIRDAVTHELINVYGMFYCRYVKLVAFGDRVLCPNGSTVEVLNTNNGLKELELYDLDASGLNYKFNSDGTVAATSSTNIYDGVTIWDVATGQEVVTFDYTENIQNYDLSPDGQHILITTQEYDTFYIDIASQQTIRTLKDLFYAGFTSDNNYFTIASGSLQIWDAATGDELTNLDIAGMDTLPDFKLSPDSALFVTLDYLGNVVLTDVNSGSIAASFNIGSGYYQIDFTPDMRWIVTKGEGITKFWRFDPLDINLTALHPVLTAPVLSPDNSLLAITQEDWISLIEVTSGLEVGTLESNVVGHLAFNFDGSRIAIANADGTINIWGLDNQLPTTVIPDPQVKTETVPNNLDVQFVEYGDTVEDVLDSGNLVDEWWFFGDSGDTVTISMSSTAFDTYLELLTESGEIIGFNDDANGQNSQINSAPLPLPGNYRIVAKSYNNSGTGAYTLTVETQGLPAVRDNQTQIASFITPRTIMNVTKLNTLSVQPDNVTALEFTPNNAYLVLGTTGGAIGFWDVVTGENTASFNLPDSVISLSLDNSGTRLAGVDESGNLRIWEGFNHQSISAQSNTLLDANFSSDGQSIVLTGTDTTVRIIDTRTSALGLSLLGHTDPVLQGIFSSDGRFVITASSDGTVRIWSTDAGEQRFSYLSDAGIRAVALHPTNRFIAIASNNNVGFWDTNAVSTVIPTVANSLAFSPDGVTLATGDTNGVVQFWSSEDGSPTGIRFEAQAEVTAITFNSDGNVLAYGDVNGTIHISAGFRTIDLAANSGQIHDLAFSPDSQLIASVSQDGIMRLWDLQSGEQIIAINAPDGTIFASVTFSPDGANLLTAVSNGTAILWGLED